MKKTVFEKPQFVEGLTLRVAPELVEKYMQVEEDIWIEDLFNCPFFIGGEVWVSDDKKGEVTSLYFWESEEAYEAASNSEFGRIHKQRSMEAMESEFVKAWHGEDRRYRVKKFERD